MGKPIFQSSPFRQKKDGSWFHGVDYMELNRTTTADRYPILMIQELLDELEGATYFSKLHLRLDITRFGSTMEMCGRLPSVPMTAIMSFW